MEIKKETIGYMQNQMSSYANIRDVLLEMIGLTKSPINKMYLNHAIKVMDLVVYQILLANDEEEAEITNQIYEILS